MIINIDEEIKLAEEKIRKDKKEKKINLTPLYIIGGIIIALLMILWIIPDYYVKIDPEPKNIPTIAEVLPPGFAQQDLMTNKTTVSRLEEYRLFVDGRDYDIKYVADRIISETCTEGRMCQAKAIYYFVQKNFNYVNDPASYDYIKTAKQSLQTKVGDCDDAAVLLANLYDAIGYRVRFVFIPEHVFIQIYDREAPKKYQYKDGWINIDGTCKNCEFGDVPFSDVNKNMYIVEV